LSRLQKTSKDLHLKQGEEHSFSYCSSLAIMHLRLNTFR
jgi:hypothetical protein